MMGKKIRNFVPLPNLSLEELVPKDNFYRRLDRKLDSSHTAKLVRCGIHGRRARVCKKIRDSRGADPLLEHAPL